jgi:uncharacterized membrane protein YidH (DUF202 family)
MVKKDALDKPDSIETANLNIAFGLCNPITVSQVDPTWPCTSKPADNMVYVYDKNANLCKPMTNPSTVPTQELMKDVDGNVNGVSLIYENKDVPADFSYKGKNLKVNIKCNKDIDNYKITWAVDDSDSKYLIFNTEAKAGCGTSLKDLVALFENYKFVAAGILCFLGILFTFFGKRFFTITLTLTGFLIGFLSIAGTAYLFSAMQTADNKKIGVIFFIAFLMGLLVGYLFYKFKVLTTMGAVGLLFFMIGNAVERLYLARWVNQQWAIISILVVFVLIGVAFGYFYSKHCIMFSTAFGGSFIVVLGLSIATNTYSPPAQIAEQIKRGDKVIYPYVWGGLWLLLGLVGFGIQLHRHKKHPEDDKEEVLGNESYSDYNRMYK